VAPTFQRLTFSRGYVSAARFAPDHQTILFSAVWSGKPVEIFSTRPQSPVSRALGVNADLLSISSNGEMAILLDPVFISGWFRGGTLARVPIDGGGPRQVLDNVGDADWSLDGSQLAVIRNTPTKRRIELPVGKVIYETDGWMSHIRFSRDGKQLAFLEHPQLGDDRGFVVVMDLEGKKKVLTKEFASESGLAWSPKGDEIWFSASQGGSNLSPLRAVTLDGKERIIASMAGNLTLQDVSPTGETLVLEDNRRREMIAYMPGDSVERDLSWMDWTFPRDLSSDGKLVLFEEQGAGGGQDYSVYIRKTDGSAAVRLGDGYAVALSPDGQTALSSLPSSASTVFLLPTGAGQPKKLNFDFYTRAFLTATWMPDGKSLIIRCSKTSSDQGRSWLYDIETGQARPITPEGIQPSVLSIDGKFLVAKCIDGGDCIYKIPTGEAEKITGLQPQDNVIGASTDPKWFYVGSQPAALTKKYEVVNIFTGERKPWKQITPPDTSGVVPPITIKITPDGTSYVYTYRRVLADLYLAKGLK
jgi:Tol biopolymer transport system component